MRNSRLQGAQHGPYAAFGAVSKQISCSSQPLVLLGFQGHHNVLLFDLEVFSAWQQLQSRTGSELLCLPVLGRSRPLRPPIPHHAKPAIMFILPVVLAGSGSCSASSRRPSLLSGAATAARRVAYLQHAAIRGLAGRPVKPVEDMSSCGFRSLCCEVGSWYFLIAVPP